MDALKHVIDVTFVPSNYDSNCFITFNDITDAVSKLKPGKHDGHFSLSSDHVSDADELYIHLAFLFSALVVNGYVTNDLSFSTVLPTHESEHSNYTATLQITEGLLSAQSSENYLIRTYSVVMTCSSLPLIYSLVFNVVSRHQ